ncbi:cupin domain-containing protein [Pseudomaricurvus sp. HS19]|uniref:cupin domain-containing protein n=1 Tax=Pseudomaricurvus sp. HS19 TaxID=2692626 RepID=UPI00136A952A|nr:cupin domain-containing protein [Pseudomaricurvus sp. HS19]MYM63647.1 cupin domain-containing protein [Pseudomaricurvus sp. HS19]
MSTRQQVIEQLQLQPHVEGGYFRRTYESEISVSTEQGPRPALTSIYYLLTREQPLGRWHCNRSDILHFWHLGGPLRYHLLHPDGQLQTVDLGPDLGAGQQLQMLVPGGVWKATELAGGDFGLLSEAVSPGFDFADMTLGEREPLLQQFPQHLTLLERFTPAP